MPSMGERDLRKPDLVRIPAGTFPMGSEHHRPDERPLHEVSVGAFLAAVTPVSNAEYAAFVRESGVERPPFAAEDRFCHPDQPVIGISWHDAVAYCEWLSEGAGMRFRLPTEAEREWAALGGRCGADWPWEGLMEAHPRYAELAGLNRPHVPTDMCANGYGLRCMAENVHEWCSDWYAKGYYGESPAAMPGGPAEGRRRVARGGSWRHSTKFTRITARASLDPGFRYNDFGFRVYAEAEQ